MSVDPTRCPLCEGANGCQVAAGHTKCWCFETPVPPAVLARVPVEAQGVACVCRACALDVDDRRRRRASALRWTKR